MSVAAVLQATYMLRSGCYRVIFCGRFDHPLLNQMQRRDPQGQPTSWWDEEGSMSRVEDAEAALGSVSRCGEDNGRQGGEGGEAWLGCCLRFRPFTVSVTEFCADKEMGVVGWWTVVGRRSLSRRHGSQGRSRRSQHQRRQRESMLGTSRYTSIAYAEYEGVAATLQPSVVGPLQDQRCRRAKVDAGNFTRLAACGGGGMLCSARATRAPPTLPLDRWLHPSAAPCRVHEHRGLSKQSWTGY